MMIAYKHIVITIMWLVWLIEMLIRANETSSLVGCSFANAIVPRELEGMIAGTLLVMVV